MADIQKTVLMHVSFAETPLAEISGKVAEIVTHGWEEADRGDPWLVLFRKGFPDTVDDPIAELREVMGDYWLTDEAQALLRSK